MSSIGREPVTLFGRRGQVAAETARDFLQRNEVPLRWVDVDLDPLAELLSDNEVETAPQPVALFADGSRLEAPENCVEPTPGRLDPARSSDYLAALPRERLCVASAPRHLDTTAIASSSARSTAARSSSRMSGCFWGG
jgi:hypothetical protein